MAEQRPTRDQLRQGLSVAIGDQNRVVIGWGVRFVRGSTPARVATPFPAAVLGRLHRWGKRPPDADLVEVEVPNGASQVELRFDGKTAAVPLTGTRSQKKLVFWHGTASDLGGATWDDIQLVDVTRSGDTPFSPLVEAHADDSQGRLGLIDVLAEDPEHAGDKRTLRFGLFRTRTPKLTFVLPNLDVADLDIFLDDGDDDTEDEVNLTAHLGLSSEVTSVDMPEFVRLNRSAVRGTTNEEGAGRNRLWVESEGEEAPDEGDCALFVFGGNRVRVEHRGEVLFTGSSLHYLEDAAPVPPGHSIPVEVVEEGEVKLTVARGSLVFDFVDDSDDAKISRALHALAFAPRAFDGTYNIVEGRALEPLEGDALKSKRREILDLHDPELADVAYSSLLVPGEVRLDRVPTALQGDYAAATHTFTNGDLHWHHFVIHTFPAHRLIESVILPQRRPPISALGGGNFDTNKTFILPGAADDLRHVLRIIDDNGDAKAAVFGHTDTVGDEASNVNLSVARAQSMRALLGHDVGWWFDRFARRNESCGPGKRELKFALKETGDFSGAIDDSDTPEFRSALDAFRARLGTGGTGATANTATRQALGREVRRLIGATGAALTGESTWGDVEVRHMRTHLGHTSVSAFQRSVGLSEDGDVGLCTRVALIRAYQHQLVATAVAADRFHPDAVFGCGEAYPAVNTGNSVASDVNRRVEVLLRRTPAPNPGAGVPTGAAVPYLEWRAPEPAGGEAGGAPPTVVVAVTDTGFGSAENFTGEQLTQRNNLFVSGERWTKPTSTAAAAAANPTLSIVRRDGDLRMVNDSLPAIPGGGHGTAVALCLGGDGVGNGVRGVNNVVLGTAPHVKMRPIQISAAGGGANFFSYMVALKVIADDPDVLVHTTSVGAFSVNLGFTANQRRALQERAQELLMRGKLTFACPQNYNFNFPTLYHAQHTQWGSIAGSGRQSRNSFTGANEYQQFLSIIGATGRVGTLAPTTTAAPATFETGTQFTYFGERIHVFMPGQQIRTAMPSGAAIVGGLGAPQASGTDTVGGIDGVSFATPLTAGVAAELILLDSSLRQRQNLRRVPEYILATADPLPRLAAAAGTGAPGNPRSGDPLIGGNANHPAFFSINRVNFWKACLAALNQGLANEGRGAAGATDAFFAFCTLKDDAATTWYGFEIRSPIADAVIWFQRSDGTFVLAEDGGALYPANRIAAGAWRSVQAYQTMSAVNVMAPASPAQNLPLPAFPFAAGSFPAGRRQYFLCQFSIKKDELAQFQSLVIHTAGVDPRGAAGRQTPPLLALRVDNRPGLRVPHGMGGAIQQFVEDFDDFVFHVTVDPQPVTRFVLVVDGGRTGVGVGETVGVQVFAVDRFGNFTVPPVGVAGTLTHDGANVVVDGTAAPAAGTALARVAPDPNGLVRFQLQANTAGTLNLTFTSGGQSGTLALTVSPAGAVASFGVVVRRRGGGASVVGSDPFCGELLEVEVTAQDSGGRQVSGFRGKVKLELESGEPGSNGPPQPRGVHVATNVRDPFSAAAFEKQVDMGNAASRVFPLIVYTPGAIRLRASHNAATGDSPDFRVLPGPLRTFRVQAQTPQSTGSSFPVTVTAEDEFQNVKDDYTGGVTLSIAAGSAAVLGPPRTGVFIGDTTVAGDDSHTFTRGDGGIHRFPVTCYTAENVQLTATATPAVGGANPGTSAAIVIQGAGALHHFRFEIRGADRAGVAAECKVIAEDASNHRIPGFTGNVTLTLAQGTAFNAAGPRGVRIQGSPHAYVAADNGEFTFTVTPNTVENIQLQAASGAISSQSAVLPIVAGTFTQFRVIVTNPVRNAPTSVRVTAVDRSGNTVTDFLGTVNLSLTRGGTRTQIASHVFTAADGGVFVYSVTLTQAGAGQIIDADDGNIRSQSAAFTLA